MIMRSVFDRFVASAPFCVAYRALVENILSPHHLDALFHRTAQVQYQRQILFSSMVDLVTQVVCRQAPSVRAEFIRQRERFGASIRAMYEKLKNVEPRTSEALVRHTAERARDLIERCGGTCRALLPGYRVRILDGNHLAKTDHRLKVLQTTAAGALPGHSLVLLDPQTMLIDEVVCCEDGHAQERTMLPQILERLHAKDLLIDDRNFCALWFLFAVKRLKAFFITRQHGRMPYKLIGKRRYAGKCPTGGVYEQTCEIRDPKTEETWRVRRVTVQLLSPTRDGDAEIHLLTNLPEKIAGVKVAQLYRKRWTLEQAFNELTMHLRCELQSLGIPKAALFAFCVAVCAYNVLAAAKGAARGAHGEVVESDFSNYCISQEISRVHGGMMVALPPEEWEVFQMMPPAKLATQLLSWMTDLDLAKYRKEPRGPKKPKRKLPNAQFKHVSTAKLLAAAKAKKRQSKAPKRLALNPKAP